MSTSDEQWQFLQDVALLIGFARQRGYKLTGGDLYRDAEYSRLFPSGTRSKHHQRMAIDLNLFVNGQYVSSTQDHRELGEFWESLRPENSWGGRFDDGNHYSRGER